MTDAFGGGSATRTVPLTLYTDAYIVKGRLETRHRRISDALNEAESGFLVLSDVQFDQYRSTASFIRAEFAQINLASVLFVTSDEVVDPEPILHTPKVTEEAMVSVPPFSVTGRIHLLPERPLREALQELRGQFLPVTNATHWSDSLGEARTTVPILAVNHARCQILAPHQEHDPWAGLGASGGVAGTTADPGADPGTSSESLGW